MIDRREEILSRLLEIISDVPGVVSAVRNREAVSGDKRPAVIMHDAAEESAGLENRPRGNTKDIIVLSPQIYILMGAPATDIGTLINGMRRILIPLILADATLRDLCATPVGANRGGDIRYSGCGLDTTTGETREARLELKFEFDYVFDLAELQS